MLDVIGQFEPGIMSQLTFSTKVSLGRNTSCGLPNSSTTYGYFPHNGIGTPFARYIGPILNLDPTETILSIGFDMSRVFDMDSLDHFGGKK